MPQGMQAGVFRFALIVYNTRRNHRRPHSNGSRWLRRVLWTIRAKQIHQPACLAAFLCLMAHQPEVGGLVPVKTSIGSDTHQYFMTSMCSDFISTH